MKYFKFHRGVSFYETDAMGIVHHSNYLRFFEECRVAWFKSIGADKLTWKEGIGFPLIEADLKYIKPARFDEPLEVRMQVRMEGLRVHFRYAVYNRETETLLSLGNTVHVPVKTEEGFKPTRLPKEVAELMEKEKWTETWP